MIQNCGLAAKNHTVFVEIIKINTAPYVAGFGSVMGEGNAKRPDIR